jgi:carbon monoxide dehydrogenase subunit G
MTVVSYSVEVNAPPKRVWDVVSDPRSLPSWERHIVGVEGVPGSGLHEGARYTTTLRLMPVRAKVAARVITWEPPYRAVIRGGPLGEVAARSLSLLGGARFLLRRGTLAQKRDVEGE